MAGGGPSTSTSTSTTNPPAWAVKGFTGYENALVNQYLPGGTWDSQGNYTPPSGGQIAPSPYVNNQVAPLSPMQEQGLQQVGNISPFAANIAASGGAENMATTSGAYLGPNPALNAYYNAAAQNMTNQYQQSTAPGITAAEVQAGGLGGSGGNQAEQYAKWGLGQNLGNLAANVYEPAYEAERGRMVQSASMAPSMAAGQFVAPGQEMQAGGLEQSQLQNILNTGVQNQQQQNLWPYTGLQAFGAGMGSVPGGTQTVVQPNLSQGIK